MKERAFFEYRCARQRFAVQLLRSHRCDAVAEVKGRRSVGDQTREIVDKAAPFSFAAFAAKGGGVK